MRKTTLLKQALESEHLEFFLEAHNALSARIVEESKHSGIWASGLAISAAMGVRDNDELSWTQILETVELMSDATSIPILLDGNTGFGNFNNARRLVKKLEQRNIAGVCLEDKLFPKTNSFIDSASQELADIDEFAGKILACKDAQQSSDFCVVARTEAFIAKRGLAEALKRAEVYRNVGADAILVHSASLACDEISQFMREWGRRCPVIIVPTTYCSTPTAVFEELGVSLVVWANQMLRASIKQMQRVAECLYEEKCLHGFGNELVSIDEIFRLQDTQELQKAEARYLPKASVKLPL